MKIEKLDKDQLTKFEFIENKVLEVTGLDKIRTKSRAHEYVLGRFLFCKLSKEYLPYSLATIGCYISRDHATVLHNLRACEWELKWNNDLQGQYEKLKIIFETQFVATMKSGEILQKIELLEEQISKLKKLYNATLNTEFENQENIRETRSETVQLDAACV